MNDIGKRALNNSHGRCVIGYFDKILHEDSLWTAHRDVTSFILHKSIFLHFMHNGTKFYDKYISTKNPITPEQTRPADSTRLEEEVKGVKGTPVPP